MQSLKPCKGFRIITEMTEDERQTLLESKKVEFIEFNFSDMERSWVKFIMGNLKGDNYEYV